MNQQRRQETHQILRYLATDVERDQRVAQGGDAEQVVRNGRNAQGTGLIINSSRAIIYAGKGEDYAVAARQSTLALRDQLNACRRA